MSGANPHVLSQCPCPAACSEAQTCVGACDFHKSARGSGVFYCIERPAGVAPHFYPAAQPSWRRKDGGTPWTTNIDEAAQYETRTVAQWALEAENWHCDPSAGIRVTEHAYIQCGPKQDSGTDDGYHPSWTPATDEEILAMCHRLLMEAPTKELCVDLVMLLQRCRIAIEIARASCPDKAGGE